MKTKIDIMMNLNGHNAYICIELANEAREVVVLEEGRENVSCKF